MAFQCKGPTNNVLDDDGVHRDRALIERTHSAFGDNYSVKSRSSLSCAPTTTKSTLQQPRERDNGHRDRHGHRGLGLGENAIPSYLEEEADYDDGATDLYRRIENKDWDGALGVLEKDSGIEQARIWVSRRELGASTKTRWRLLPLHAVCIFRAPLALIEALLEAYPGAARCKDDQGMLPLHLACRNGASKGVVLTLLAAYDDSIVVRDRKGRSPLDLVEASSSANKESVLRTLQKFERDRDAKQMLLKPNHKHHQTGDNKEKDHHGHGHGGGGGGGGEIKKSRSRSNSRGKNRSGENDPSSPQAEANANANTPGGNATVSSTDPQAPPHGNNSSSAAGHHVVVANQHGGGGSGGDGTTVSTTKTPEVDYEHRTVLFRLILKKDWKPAAARAVAYQDEACTWIVTKGFNGNLRFLPLHKACVLQPPESVVESLIEAYPEGCFDKDQDGWLPLHCACFYGADEKAVAALLRAHPKGAHNKDDEGRLPLHYACLKGASQGVVDALLETFPKGAMSKDEEGRLPIHHACGKGAPEGVIDALLKASPKGAQSKDDQGRLALHHACRKNASERVIRTLLRVYPRASQIKDDQDKLPIHYACQHAASAHVVTLLVATYPESVHVQNGFGYTPLGEAKNAAESNPKMVPVVKLLEKTKREQDKLKAESGETAEVQAKLTLLEYKIAHLDKSLSRIGVVGKEMKHDLVKKNKDPKDVLEKFADRLIELGAAGKKDGDNKTPLKVRTSTPIKSLFGLGKDRSDSKKKDRSDSKKKADKEASGSSGNKDVIKIRPME